MAGPWLPLWSMPDGRQTFFRDNEDGTYTVWSQQQNDPILERNKAMATHNDGYSPTRELRRVGSVPLAFIADHKARTGVDLLSPNFERERKRFFNDGDFAHMRNAPGSV